MLPLDHTAVSVVAACHPLKLLNNQPLDMINGALNARGCSPHTGLLTSHRVAHLTRPQYHRTTLLGHIRH